MGFYAMLVAAKPKPAYPIVFKKSSFAVLSSVGVLFGLEHYFCNGSYLMLLIPGFQHHSYRSFLGLTCLMQISTRTEDFIIDTLELRSEMNILNETFTDPAIVKVSCQAHHHDSFLFS